MHKDHNLNCKIAGSICFQFAFKLRLTKQQKKEKEKDH